MERGRRRSGVKCFRACACSFPSMAQPPTVRGAEAGAGSVSGTPGHLGWFGQAAGGGFVEPATSLLWGEWAAAERGFAMAQRREAPRAA